MEIILIIALLLLSYCALPDGKAAPWFHIARFAVALAFAGAAVVVWALGRYWS